MKIIDFIKKNKVPTIAASVMLVAAIAVGVTFGVLNHKDNIETNEPFGNESSSTGSSSTISVPPIEGNSSEENTSSEDSPSSASETIETNSTPSKAESVSSAQSSSNPTTTTKPASSQPSNTTPSTPVTSTPSNSTGGGNTETGSKWVCPDPSAHPQESVSECISQHRHNSFVAQYQEQEANKDKTPTRNPEDVGVKCWICGRPFGDGYNGTCLNYFCDGSYKCHHYDTGETCQIKHGG